MNGTLCMMHSKFQPACGVTVISSIVCCYHLMVSVSCAACVGTSHVIRLLQLHVLERVQEVTAGVLLYLCFVACFAELRDRPCVHDEPLQADHAT
jgi:hypothetical protein